MSSIFYLDRPEVANALDLQTTVKLQKEMDQAIKNKSSGFIITSKFQKNFCSGGDLKAFLKMKSKRDGMETHRKIRKILTGFRKKPIVIVCAIEGDAVGGGCELALACDYVIAGSSARFAFRQVHQNLSPGWGGTKNLLRRVERAQALDWLTSGRWISAQEALNRGLVDQITSSGKALSLSENFLQNRDSNLIGLFKDLISKEGRDEEKVFEKLWWSPPHRRAMGKLT